ncbi:MAG TPA: fibronectin type III domain-containing protein [Paludibacter sp.]|nr:fibronectin type III domain-containing protein [Paludibacter sp.]
MRISLLFFRGFLSFLFLTITMCALSQNNSYLGLDGGFEGLSTIENTATGDALPRANKWVKANAALTISKESTVVRSGNNSLKVTTLSGSTYRVWSPLITIPESSTRWVVQYYRRAAITADGIQSISNIYRGAAEAKASTYNTVSVANLWEKVIHFPISVTAASAAAGGVYCKRIVAGGDMYFDDFCLYESAIGEDVTVPDAPKELNVHPFTSTSLALTWKAPLTGVDGGGYLIVRGIVDPLVSPNPNGIYAVGNLISPESVVVYQGTEKNFIDTGLSTGSQYFYRIYTYDKAYNYSAAVQISGVVVATLPTITVVDAVIPTMITNVGASRTEIVNVSAINLTDVNGVALAVSGENANFFSLSKQVIEQSTGIVLTTPITITYRPTVDGLHSAILTASSAGVPNSVYNLNGTARILSGIETHKSNFILSLKNGCILFAANEGDVVELYNAMGQKLVSKIAVQGLNAISLNSRGVVVLKVGEKIAKAIL